jgi:hypothetical protein
LPSAGGGGGGGVPMVAAAEVLATRQQSKQRQQQQHDNNTTTNTTTNKTANAKGGKLSGRKETVFETVFFLECPGMSRPLDSAMPGRPPKVPFFWRERYVFEFLGEKTIKSGSN